MRRCALLLIYILKKIYINQAKRHLKQKFIKTFFFYLIDAFLSGKSFNKKIKNN